MEIRGIYCGVAMKSIQNFIKSRQSTSFSNKFITTHARALSIVASLHERARNNRRDGASLRSPAPK